MFILAMISLAMTFEPTCIDCVQIIQQVSSRHNYNKGGLLFLKDSCKINNIVTNVCPSIRSIQFKNIRIL